MKIRRTTSAGRNLAACVAAVTLLASCSGSQTEDTAADEGVATLSGNDESAAAAGTSADDDASAEEAALGFAACMRDNDVDFPDPTVDADGNPSFAGAFGPEADRSLNPRSEEFQAAMTACQSLTDGLAFGGGPRANGNREAIQDALLPYTDCLRTEGLDVGDFQFGAGPGAGDGQGAAGAEGEGAEGNGQGRGARRGGGDPGARIPLALGLDPEDPEVAAALQVCEPLLLEAFAGFGPNAEEAGA